MNSVVEACKHFLNILITRRLTHNVIIDNHLKNRRRGNARYTSHLEALAQVPIENPDFLTEERAIDIVDALESLPALENKVGVWLSEGYSKNEIRKKLGCRWEVVDQAAKRIREYFETLGLNDYLTQY